LFAGVGAADTTFVVVPSVLPEGTISFLQTSTPGCAPVSVISALGLPVSTTIQFPDARVRRAFGILDHIILSRN
jgi:hypothetical protein